MRLVLATALSLVAFSQEAAACSPSLDWRPPTVEEALSKAEIVLQAKVIAVERDSGVSLATVSVEQVLKGKYSGRVVETGGGGHCGLGTFNVGQTYVLFFEQRGTWWVSGFLQPRSGTLGESRPLDASEVLSAVAAISKRNHLQPGVWVSEAEWDLPPYKTTLSTMRLLQELELEYQRQRSKASAR